MQGRVAVSTWAADQDHLALVQWACGRGHTRGMPGRAGMQFRVVGDTDRTSRAWTGMQGRLATAIAHSSSEDMSA